MIKRDIETLDKINYGGIMFEQGRKEREAEIIDMLEDKVDRNFGKLETIETRIIKKLIKQIKENRK